MGSKSLRSVAEVTDESVMKRIDSCLENMDNLLLYKADDVVPLREELEGVKKRLRFLKNLLAFNSAGKLEHLQIHSETVAGKIGGAVRTSLGNFLCFAAKRSNDDELGKFKDLLIHAEIVANNIACLLTFCFVNDTKMDDEMISWMKLELLSRRRRIIRPEQPEVREIYINTIKATNSAPCTPMAAQVILGFLDSLRENLLELSEKEHGYDNSVKDQMLALYEDMRFLEYLVLDSPCIDQTNNDHWPKFKYLHEQKNILILEVACLIYSLAYDEKNEHVATEKTFLVCNLSEKFKVAKEEVRQIYDELCPKCLRYNFPSTNARGYINSFLGNLRLVLSSNKADSIAPLKHHLQAVLDELMLLREVFIRTEKQACGSEHEELDHLWTRFKDVVYHSEFVIDSFFAEDGDIWIHKLGLFDVNEEIRTIKKELNHVLIMKAGDEGTVLWKISSTSSKISLQTSPENEVAVFELQYQIIMEKLTKGPKELQILSIVGMPGIGKTTLANAMFQKSSNLHHFHVYARCCLSETDDRKTLLLELLKGTTGLDLECSVEDLEHKLYKGLKGRKYLIFLDDIWDCGLLRSMRWSFPNDKNGSRIMLTSRLSDIASQAGLESITYHLSPLTDDQSWEMLQFKVFGKCSCPQELVRIGKQIATNCRGLPLTIDLIAGILRERGGKQDCWHEVARNFLTELAVDDPQGRCRKAFEISYKHLPNDLKPCFLYFGAFPEDSRIPARRLRLLWITEGFVQLPENEETVSLEDAANSYLDQLISRNLIMVSQRGSLGTVRECHIHDLLHDFAVAKAIEERFLLPIDSFSDFSISSTKGHPWYEQSRLCIHPCYTRQFFISNPSGPRVRSLVFPDFDSRIQVPRLDLSKFKILRVFDLPNTNIRYSAYTLLQLIHIRFLSLRCCRQNILSEILRRLQSLETLIVGKIEGVRILRQEDITNMAKLRFLRHFQVFYIILPRTNEEFFEKQMPDCFGNLHYLSFLSLRFGMDGDEQLLRQMPNLRKLKCTINDVSLGNLMRPVLDLVFLKYLESLTTSIVMDYKNLENMTSIFSFPPYLKKLKLLQFPLPRINISSIGKLEHLEVLKLDHIVFPTNTLDMVGFGQQFPKLKYLRLRGLHINEWYASVEDIPVLEQLEVLHCWDLKELPSCLSNIQTLLRIHLFSCPKSLEISAHETKQNQVELGNEQLVVVAEDMLSF